ncbi:Hypothetical protein GbCGDNIH9_2358 [Granulibacter bethesdensis]|uniref:Lipoprotein n=1 Tax=Granulibacter bethesdensis TaxID=364410 RepID=A0AAC9KCS3_9PROT|nr:Hypothetical protein GbCGDNIH9_2358 [Granulibacter bethesdensis]APH63274.1 Hypothetical protein GbCGDNIH8_2358 [Granulibacter bethesdensis]
MIGMRLCRDGVVRRSFLLLAFGLMLAGCAQNEGYEGAGYKPGNASGPYGIDPYAPGVRNLTGAPALPPGRPADPPP